MNKNVASEIIQFDQYYDSFYKPLHEWRDYEKVSSGYGEYYYDCLPSNREAKILDIGCGDGKLLFFLKNKGYTNIEGLELSTPLAEITSKKIGCQVHVVDDTIAFLDSHQALYNTITMNDVLEHVPKEYIIRFVTAVRKALVPGGNFVVNVPQVSGFSSLYCRYNDFTHQIVFTEMSLRQVLTLGGFDDVRYISEKWLFKVTPRHLSYRLVRWIWFSILKLIYFIEQPGEIVPSRFQVRLVASACFNSSES